MNSCSLCKFFLKHSLDLTGMKELFFANYLILLIDFQNYQLSDQCESVKFLLAQVSGIKSSSINLILIVSTNQ